MASQLRISCWKCNEVFPTLRSRKNHLSSREHGCMRVVCPFCPKERLFKRSTPELKEHMTTKHRDDAVELKDDFFSENNGFWLSIYPRDYRRLVTPSPARAPSAIKARELVRAWFDTAQVQRHRREEWESEWNAEMKKRGNSQETSNFTPDYEEEMEPQTKRLKYTPDDPAITDSLELCSIKFQENPSLTVHSHDHTLWYNLTLRSLDKDPKLLASVLRRVRGCSENPPTFKEVKYPGKQLSKHLASTIGLEESDIISVKKGVQATFTYTASSRDPETNDKERNVRKEEKNSGMGESKQDKNSKEENSDVKNRTEEKNRKEDNSNVKSRTEEKSRKKENSYIKNSIGEMNGQKDIGEIQNRTEERSRKEKGDSCIVNMPGEKESGEMRNGTEERNRHKDGEIQSRTEERSRKEKVDSYIVNRTEERNGEKESSEIQSRTEEMSRKEKGDSCMMKSTGEKNGEKDGEIQSRTEERNGQKESCDVEMRKEENSEEKLDLDLFTYKMHSPPIADTFPYGQQQGILLAFPISTPSHPTVDGRQRAMRLLSTGVMPLLPPGKREWTGVPQVCIIDSPVPLSWPPPEWETFSPEQRLHAWEMAAIIITSKDVLDFAVDKNYLLSCFNFLCLPGSAMPILTKNQANEINMRLYNYKAVCDVAVCGVKNRQQEKLLEMLEQCTTCRDTSMDWIIERLDECHVKLRLPKLVN